MKFPIPLPRLFRFLMALACLGNSSAESITGRVGVGTWSTQAEFKDIKVTKDGKTLFESDFSKGMNGWQTRRGQWEVVDGALRQTGNETDSRAVIGDPGWSDITLTLKARKLGGNEGFLILFGMPEADPGRQSWWNLGGWGNTQYAIQSPGMYEQRQGGRIEDGRWYEIKLELEGETVRAFLDGELVQSGTRPSDEDAQREFPHALIPALYADPAVAEFDGTFYCYGTTDGMGQGLATAGLPVVWKSKDFLHWSFEGSIFPPNFDAKYWAPSAPVEKGGRYYLFPTLDNHITALVAPAPEGPFRTLDRREVTQTSGWKPLPIHVGHPIDAEVFRDDDGSYYMVWSQRFIAKMKPDFSGFEGEPVEIRTKRGAYSEGPQLIKRKGVYYYLYTLDGYEDYKYAYMMSRESPLGPWEWPDEDIIAVTDHEEGIFGPGHGCFFSPKDSDPWYFIHLEFGRGSVNRQVVAQKMEFRPDGTIEPIKLSLEGVGALRDDPRYRRPNLARGKSATASSIRPDQRIPPRVDFRLNRIETYGPAQAIDGSNGSRWMASEDDRGAWFELDLGEARDIERTELYFVKPTAGHTYRLESSLDGKSWHAYGGHDDLRVQSPHIDSKPVRARFLRLTIQKGTPGLWEFQVY